MPRRAFTIIELLVVVGIIVLLVGILIVGLSGAARSAQGAQTRALMSSIANALVRFKADVGYLPPVLGPGGTQVGAAGFGQDLRAVPPAFSNASANQVREWFSPTSLATYLIGAGNRNADGFGCVGDPGFTASSPPPGARERPTLGIKHPGRDGVWGASFTSGLGAPGQFSRRSTASLGGNQGYLKGRVYGPYLELKDPQAVGALVDYQSIAPGEALVPRAVGPSDSSYPTALPGASDGVRQNFGMCILDYWGSPIIYYRKGYVNGDPRYLATREAVAGSPTCGFDLSDMPALRPQRFDPGTQAQGSPDAAGDSFTSRELFGAEFALLSPGPDRRWDPRRRVGLNQENADNIVVTGP
jgi:type II secretory pathway pseudopilin PulG